MRFLVKNFGCRASQADGAAIEAGLSAKGLASTAEMGDAELVVLNTCTVTATADDEVRHSEFLHLIDFRYCLASCA